MKNEYKLILLAVLRKRTKEEADELRQLFERPLNWEMIGGQVIYHRLGGYFYTGLPKELRSKLPKELSRALGLLVLAQKRRTLETIKTVLPVLKEFEQAKISYAGLKGLIFNANIYTPGDRRSNDTDLLLDERDIEKIDDILRRNGYIQSFMRKGELKEATRKEKLIQRMNYHDLVPYYKKVDMEFLNVHSFDINFHFDSKDNDITKSILEYGTKEYDNGHYKVKGLVWETHFIHLCSHFYREGSNSLWTARKKDIELYKVVDLINTFRDCNDETDILKVPRLMKKYNVNKAGYFTIFILSSFYNDPLLKQILSELEPENKDFMNEIKIEGENRTVKRSVTFEDSVFNLTY